MRLIREVRSFYTTKAAAGDWGAIAFVSGAALVGLVIAVLIALMPFVENVSAGEIVVCETSSGGEKDVTIWNGDKDPASTGRACAKSRPIAARAPARSRRRWSSTAGASSCGGRLPTS